MNKPTMVRVDDEGLQDQVGCVRDGLAQLESYYRDIDVSIKELCTTHWVSTGSEKLLKKFERDSAATGSALKALRSFYTQSLSWVVPQYTVLEEVISDEVKNLVKGS